MKTLDLTNIEEKCGEHVYYHVELNTFFIGWWNIGNFVREDHTGRHTYIYLGEL